MEFHGTTRVIEIGAVHVPWNSMELFVSSKLAHPKFHGIAWNHFFCYLMEPLASSILWVLNLDRIPWNLSFQVLMKIISHFAELINFRKSIRTLCRCVSLFHQLMFYYQYLHYTICISGNTHYVSKYHSKSVFNAHWNLFWSKSSMELFQQHLNNTCGSMEFYGTSAAKPQVPWNSMEFHGILSRFKVPWNFMELFPYSRVPWNSMEFHGTFSFPQKCSMVFHGIPWNFLVAPWNHEIPWNLINLIFKKNHISEYCCWYLIDD